MAVTNGNDDRDRRDRAAAGGTRRWLPWVLGALALLLLILALRSCGDDEADRATTTGANNAAMAPAGTPVGATAGGEAAAWNSAAFTSYLVGSEPVGRAFALDQVTFASGSSLIRNEAQGQIGEVAAALRARPTARVSLRGYADPAGDAAANQELSETRTQAVRNALIKAGASENQIEAASAMGETGDAATEANRRVEITVTAR
jgi:outer membrane protein OmpA-like peptidoglycan-associated protein